MVSSSVVHTIAVQIVRFTDASPPGWVECVLCDVMNREWLLSDKLPVFTTANLDGSSNYPQPGMVACEIVREWTCMDGLRRCLINTALPWGVSAENGETQFEVFADQITTEAS